jgi:hypothetical protein
MVEHSIAWLVTDGCRRVPYRGIDRDDLWWSVRVAAVNLRRLLALGLTRQARPGHWPDGLACGPGSLHNVRPRAMLCASSRFLDERPDGQDRRASAGS